MNEFGVGTLLVLVLLSALAIGAAWLARRRSSADDRGEARGAGSLAALPIVFVLLMRPASDLGAVRWLDEFFRTPLPPEQAGLVVQAGQRALSDGRVVHDRSDRDGYVLYLRNDSDWFVTSVWGTIEFEFHGLPPRSVSGLLPMYVQSSSFNVSWPQSDFSLIELDLDLGEDPIAQTLTVESVRGYRR